MKKFFAILLSVLLLSSSITAAAADYTVDFHFGENDEEVFRIEGGSSILLSELFEEIGYDEHTAAEATEVKFTDPELLEVIPLINDWKLQSLESFLTDETLTIAFENGDVLNVRVSDAKIEYTATADGIAYGHKDAVPYVKNSLSIDYLSTENDGLGNPYYYVKRGLTFTVRRTTENSGAQICTRINTDSSAESTEFSTNPSVVRSDNRYPKNLTNFDQGTTLSITVNPNSVPGNQIDLWSGRRSTGEIFYYGATIHFRFYEDHYLHYVFSGDVPSTGAVLPTDTPSNSPITHASGNNCSTAAIITENTPNGYADVIENGYVYHFEGWEPSIKDNATATATGCIDVTYTGKWKKTALPSHSITYTYTGTVPSTAPAAPADETKQYTTENIAVKDAPKVEGYEFSGWSTSDVAVSEGKFTMPDKDVAFSGYFTAKNDAYYTVHYYKTGTTVKVADDKSVNNATYDKEYTETAETVTGYTPEKGSDTIVAKYGNELIFYYTVNSYNATADDSDEGIESTDGSGTYDYGGEVTFEAEVKPGYTFDGWYDNADGTGDPVGADTTYKFTMPDEAVTYYPKTTEQKVIYTYTAKCKDTVPDGKVFGAVVTPEGGSEEVGKATGEPKAVATVNSPTFRFLGWFDNENGTGDPVCTTLEFAPSDKDEQGLLKGGDFYAVFEYNLANYTVKHFQQNIDDDQYTEVTDDKEEKSGTVGQKTEASAKTYTGFEAQTFEQVTITADGNAVVEIYYNRNKHDITYTIENDDPEERQSKTIDDVKYGATIEDYTPVRENYDFDGWYTDNKYTKPWENPGTMPDEDITVYGKFIRQEGSLTIGKKGMKAGESAIFVVTGEGLPDTGLEVVVLGSEGTVTIEGLLVGATYTVTEKENWSWRYTAADNSLDVEIEAKSGNYSANFENKEKIPEKPGDPDPTWPLSKEVRKTNIFGKATKPDAPGDKE